MPGVPTSRGCLSCRKVKKKCEGETSPCIRCRRLSLQCVGFGELRYVFRDENAKLFEKAVSIHGPRVLSYDQSVIQIRPSLGNGSNKLIHDFIAAADPKVSVRYQLLWNFGLFLEDIPQRIGHSTTLDAAADALMAAYIGLRSPDRSMKAVCLTKYGKALTCLRRSLQDPSTARATETLCSAALLMIFEALAGASEATTISHAGGSAKILKYRGLTEPRDEFESKILMTLRGPVIVQALVSDENILSEQEWQDLVENSIDGDSVDVQSLRVMARLPSILHRSRRVLRGLPSTQEMLELLQNEASLLREESLSSRTALRLRLEAFESQVGPPEEMTGEIGNYHVLFARAAGLALTVEIIIDLILAALHQHQDAKQAFLNDAAILSEVTVDLAHQVDCHRPLGTVWMPLCLRVAYAGATTLEAKRIIHERCVAFAGDLFTPDQVDKKESLDRLSRYLRLDDVQDGMDGRHFSGGLGS